jgi:hypothetical protein
VVAVVVAAAGIAPTMVVLVVAVAVTIIAMVWVLALREIMVAGLGKRLLLVQVVGDTHLQVFRTQVAMGGLEVLVLQLLLIQLHVLWLVEVEVGLLQVAHTVLQLMVVVLVEAIAAPLTLVVEEEGGLPLSLDLH